MQHCGHVPQVERPEETNELLLDFFPAARSRAGERDLTAATRRGRLRDSRGRKAATVRRRGSPVVASLPPGARQLVPDVGYTRNPEHPLRPMAA